MKHFIKIEPGAFKYQRPANCQSCGGKVDKERDNFLLETHWRIKRKADKLTFCSLKCLSKWAH